MVIQSDGKVPLIEILEDANSKKELLRILDDSTDDLTKRAEITFKIALQGVSLEEKLCAKDRHGNPHHLPFFHYLMSNHPELMNKFRYLYRNKFITAIESTAYETKHWSDTLQTNLNLITLIGQTDIALLVALLKQRPHFIAHIDWSLMCTGSDSLPKSALSNIALLPHEHFTPVYELLVQHKETFSRRVSMTTLLRPIAIPGKGFADTSLFDDLIHRQSGIKLITLLADKMIKSPLFHEVFTEGYLSDIVIMEDVTIMSTGKRIALLAKMPPIMAHLIASREQYTNLIPDLMEIVKPSDETIREFSWNAFSVMLRDGCDDHRALNALIEHHGEALKKQPATIWHEPLTPENYSLMHLVMRRYANTPIEAFFKAAFPVVYQNASQTLGQARLTPSEGIAKLEVTRMMQERSVELFHHHLRDRSTYPLYSIHYTASGGGCDAILSHLFTVDEFRHGFLTLFESTTGSGRYDDFLFFIQHNNINQLVHFVVPFPNNKIISIPLIHFLCQTKLGIAIIRNVLESEPRPLVKAISFASLTQAMPLIANPSKTTSLLHYLANEAIDIFSKICEYSDVLENASEHYFQQPTTPDSSEVNLFGFLIKPLLMKPLDGPRCLTHLTALCHLLEAAPNAQTRKTDKTVIKDSKLEYTFFESLKKVIPPALINRFLFLLGANEPLLKIITKKYQLPKATPAPELQQRRIKLSGLLPNEMERYGRMLNKKDVHALNDLLDEPNAAWFLMQPLGASRPNPLFIYLLENETLKHCFLTTVSRRLKANPHDPIGALFTKPALSRLVRVQSHTVPVLFELMQNDLGYSIIEALEQTQPNFYARIHPPIFTCVYYSRQYQTEVSLLFLASHQRQASCLRMLSQNNVVKRNLSSLPLVYAYVLPDGTSQSILSNLVLTIKTEKDEQVAAIYDIICHRNHHIYRITSADDWLAKNHVLEPQGPKISLLDLMLVSAETLGILCSLMAHYSHNIAEQEDLEAYIIDFIAYVNNPHSTLNSEMKLGLLYLLNQEDTPTRLMRLMPNGQTLLSTLLPNEVFCYTLNTSLSTRAFTDDAEDRYVDFFNHIGVETSVMTAPGERKPLLSILMRKRFSSMAIKAIYENENSRYFYQKNTLAEWVHPFYQFLPDDERSRCSHLDLMLFHEKLTDTAKKIIEIHLDNFINHYCNVAYLTDPVFIYNSWVNRMMLLLKHQALHTIALKVLKHCALPAKTLAALLSSQTYVEKKQGVTLFDHLEQSESGRQLIEYCSTVKSIGDFLSHEMRARCVNHLLNMKRTNVSVTQHGMFPPVTPTVRVVETGEDAMNILNSVLNIPSKK